ncbi:MAG: NfeD family protein [Betaproteobacteria bacterium]|nr:NfeD family protein [Betaproteobacteria bacterium]
MDASLGWAILGLALVIAELLTGTFYLLMLGVAGFGAAAAAWMDLGFEAQIIVFAIVAAAGCYGVHAYRAKDAGRRMPSIDAGKPATFETWIDEAARLARVRYRGAPWEARIEGTEAPQPGALVYVVDTDGNTLKVATRPPA